ncbi:MAG: hypothetical protein KGL39_57235 [Patescibacteria group bacterium]|nr:hypothetical protein [Patescibacteria group bacterium]
MKVIIEDDSGNCEQILLNLKTFKTGNHGYHGIYKGYFNGKKYMCNIILVELG